MRPILKRELLEVLRGRQARVLQFVLALACALLVLVRWPTGDVVDLNGARSLQVLRVFGYGLLAGILLLVPAFPATALVREKVKGTLALLLNSPLPGWSIYLGKLAGVLGFTAVLLTMTLPAAAACQLLGGTTSRGGILALYAILAIASVQLATLALLVSSVAQSTDGALRATYALVLGLCVLSLGPDVLLRGREDTAAQLASWLRCLSPIPPVMEILGHGDVGSHGMSAAAAATPRYLLLATLTSLVCAVATILRLDQKLLDRSRPAGVMTQDRSVGGQVFRRLLFLVDPRRRSGSMTLWINPVMVKEFRARRLGRSHWMLRMIALCAILSLGLSYVATTGALAWGIEALGPASAGGQAPQLQVQAGGIQIIGGALVLLQVALLILFAPSLAAGLVSAERESGTWLLLRMTPLSAGRVLRGKLLSVAWPLVLLLCATLPGYVVMMTIRPELAFRIQRVVLCLVMTAVFAVLLSAALSTLFRSTARATSASYIVILAICVGPLLIWLGRDAPFGQSVVESFLTVSPVGAALQAADTPGFSRYNLFPASWWVLGATCLALLAFLFVRMWQLCQPE
jgi:ABC-type transport system involved in multi-copper enzyme maturation permease subunit